MLIALGALLTGTLLGFLFGIPRTLSQPLAPAASVPAEGTASDTATEEQEDRTAARTEYQGNTNLEQISDWLTKIIVGLTLVQFDRIKTFIKNLVAYLAAGLGSATAYGPYVLTLLVLFAICGFFIGYLLTRLYLGLAFLKSDLEGRIKSPSAGARLADALPAIRKARTALGARNANSDRGRTLERAEQVAESA